MSDLTELVSTPAMEEAFALLRRHDSEERRKRAAVKCAQEGHDPIDVTPLSSLTLQYVCNRCSERWEEDQ